MTSGVVAAGMQTEKVIIGDIDFICKNFICLNEIASETLLIQ